MRTVTVTGSGISKVAPDSAIVRVAAVRRGVGVAEAYDAMSAGAAQIVEVAVRHTEQRHIASTGISVWPFHDHEGKRQGYEARHGYAIGCADLAEAGVLLGDLAREIGDGLAVDSVGLEVTDDHVRCQQGPRGRVPRRARAGGRARADGRTGLGAVQSIVEGGAGGDHPSGSPKMAMMRDSGGGLEPGETSVSTTVTVVWELV